MPFFHYIAIPKPDKEEETLSMKTPEDFMNRFIDLILESEGGYVNDPLDRGGATKYGITQKTLNAWTVAQKIKPIKARDLPLSTARTIYMEWYLKPCLCANLAVTLLIFDWGVNSGVMTAIMGLQKILGVKQDGILGPLTNKAIMEYAPREMLLTRIVNKRHEYYANIIGKDKSQSKFAIGWATRITKLVNEIDRERLFDAFGTFRMLIK